MDFEKRIKELNEEIVNAKAISRYEEVIKLYNAVSYIYRTRGEWTRCEETLKNAIAYAQKYGLSESLGILWSSLGAIYIEMGKLALAENYLNKALQNLDGNHTKLASTYGNLGKSYLFKGKWDSAIDNINKAIIEGNSGDNSDSNLMSSNTTLARIESERGIFDNAETYFQNAEKHAGRLKFTIESSSPEIDYQEQPVRDIVHYCELLLARSNFMRYQGLIEEAIEYAHMAINFADSIDYYLGLNEAKLALVKCNLAQNDIQAAKSNLPSKAKVISPSQAAGILMEEAILFSLMAEKEGSSQLAKEAKDLFSDSICRFNNLGHIYDEHVAIVNKGMFLTRIDHATNYALEIKSALQEIRNMGIVSESIELVQEIEHYLRCKLREFDDCLTKAITKEFDSSIQATDKEYQKALLEALGVQNKLLKIGSDLNIIERISSLLVALAPNDDLQEEYELLNEQILCEIDICNNNYKLSKNQAVIYENKLRESKQRVDDKNNLLLQILQSVFSGIGISNIFISIINSFNIEFSKLILLLLCETCIAWALLPLSVFFLANKENRHLKFCLFNVILVLISIGGLYITIR